MSLRPTPPPPAAPTARPRTLRDILAVGKQSKNTSEHFQTIFERTADEVGGDKYCRDILDVKLDDEENVLDVPLELRIYMRQQGWFPDDAEDQQEVMISMQWFYFACFTNLNDYKPGRRWFDPLLETIIKPTRVDTKVLHVMQVDDPHELPEQDSQTRIHTMFNDLNATRLGDKATCWFLGNPVRLGKILGNVTEMFPQCQQILAHFQSPIQIIWQSGVDAQGNQIVAMVLDGPGMIVQMLAFYTTDVAIDRLADEYHRMRARYLAFRCNQWNIDTITNCLYQTAWRKVQDRYFKLQNVASTPGEPVRVRVSLGIDFPVV